VVYANNEDYASFPQLALTDNELALLFQVQNLATRWRPNSLTARSSARSTATRHPTSV
jgi:hypothetical protein